MNCIKSKIKLFLLQFIPIMSLIPSRYWDVSPFEPYENPWSMDLSPYARPLQFPTMTQNIRNLERELGGLISSVKMDDKSFQVIFYSFEIYVVRIQLSN